MNIRSFIVEALNASEIREIMSVGRKLADKRINEIWPKLEGLCKFKSKRGDRLYFDYDVDLQKLMLSDTSKDVISFLRANNYKITDYFNGFAEKDNKVQKISRILLDLIKKGVENAEDALKKFNKDVYRSGKGKNLLFVISRHPYDIAGSSTGRGWTSCMNLRGGMNKEFVAIDVSQGAIISYLIDEKDLNINNPIARILIKPYLEVNNKENVLYGIENEYVKYGSAGPAYVKALILLFDKVQGEKTGFFKIDNELYTDGIRHKVAGNLTPEQVFFIKAGNPKYDRNKDNSISIFGHVNISELGISNLPFTIRDCTGNFNIARNQFNSLKNCPQQVGLDFICNSNNLYSLEHGPKYVGKHYLCSHNNLSSLKGCVDEVNGDFDCDHNQLTNLNFGPSKVLGSYDCSDNNLTSLYGCPIEIKGNFSCRGNHLEALHDGPKSVKGNYVCGDNKLISFIGAPELVGGHFHAVNNPNLRSLEGLPRAIGGDLNIKHTAIADFFSDDEIREKCKIIGDIHR